MHARGKILKHIRACVDNAYAAQPHISIRGADSSAKISTSVAASVKSTNSQGTLEQTSFCTKAVASGFSAKLARLAAGSMESLQSQAMMHMKPAVRATCWGW